MISTSPIKPSVGRVVLFTSTTPSELGAGGSSVVPALVTHVHSDNCVNLMVMRDGHGETPTGVTSVPYVEPEEGDVGPFRGWYWMPYQKQVAAVRDAQTGIAVQAAGA